MYKFQKSKAFIQVAIFLGIIAAFNLVILHFAQNSVPRQVLRNAYFSEKVTDIFVGNSLMQSGFAPKVFETNLSNRKAINLGLGSSSPVEHYLLLKSLLKSSPNQKLTIYYGFFDNQLTDPVVGDYESLFGNRAASYYIEPETAISLYAPNSFIKSWQLRLIGKVPMLVERAAIWANVERIRRILGEIGMQKVAVNQFGRNQDFQLLEASDHNTFALMCQNVVQTKVRFNSGVNSIIQLVNKRNLKIIFILMPMTQKHREKFYTSPSWKAYQSYLSNLIQANGGSLVDASDWIADDGFSDALHLNVSGAKIFSKKIAIYNIQSQ